MKNKKAAGVIRRPFHFRKDERESTCRRSSEKIDAKAEWSILITSHRTWFLRVADRLVLYFCYHDIVDGLPLCVFDDKKDAPALLKNVREALELIRDTDSYRYRRVVKRLNRIIIHPLPHHGEYIRELRRCTISSALAKSGDIKKIALIIIHESTHAELYDRGIGYSPETRARVEDVCARQEIAFGRKFDNSVELLREAEARLTYPEEVWSNEAISKRELDWMEQQGVMPKWLLRLLAKRRARLLARHRLRKSADDAV
ncbi:hypothetical protein [Rhizobium sp.]